jgi:hypothetical protein
MYHPAASEWADHSLSLLSDSWGLFGELLVIEEMLMLRMPVHIYWSSRVHLTLKSWYLHTFHPPPLSSSLRRSP